MKLILSVTFFLLSVIKVVSSDLESGLRTLGVATFCGPDVLKRFPVVVEKTEARFCDFSDAKSVSKSLLALADSESINESLARVFVDTNRDAQIFKIDAAHGWKGLASEEFNTYFSQGDAKQNWEKFKNKFPDALGIVKISRVVLDETKSEGLMSIWCQYSAEYGRGGYLKFRKLGELWWCYEILDAPTGES